MRSMIYRDGDTKVHSTCICCRMPSLDDNVSYKDEVIPVFYSAMHAKDEGWVFTKDIMFCPHDKDGVWVCPDCANKRG